MNSKYKRKDSGFKFDYKGQHLSLKEMAEIAGCSTSTAHRELKDFCTKPEIFVEKMKRKRLLKNKLKGNL